MTPELDELLQKLDGFTRTQSVVEHEWGTTRLDEYLLSLLSDTRDGKRHGFPNDVAFALMQIQLLNLAHLESAGIVQDEPDLNSRFVCSPTQWTLPKNF